jgi:4-amino-4-deoxy-L-arabinose transferase-like glycosyltransferase
VLYSPILFVSAPSVPVQPSLPKPRFFIVLTLLFGLLWFGQLDYRKLVKPDEGRYAEISREMAASGDWVTPRLNGLKYFEKPPMQYWATAAAFRVFGVNEWTARLWTALTGFAGVLLAAFAARRLYGRHVGLLAGMVLGSSFYQVALGHINTLDMGVSFFLELALVGFLLAHRDQASDKDNRNWMLITWAAMAGAMLSKGLIGLVLPGAALVIYVVLTGQWRLLARMHWGKGLLLFALLTLPWFVLVSQRNPEFLHFFFIHEHFQRFTTDVARRVEPWWIFIPLLALGISPWLSWLGQSLRDGVRAESNESFRPGLLLVIWSVFIFVFFSLSQSKLPAYILPVFPALAILLARYLVRQDGKTLQPHFGLLALLAALLAIAAWLAPSFRDFSSDNTPAEMIHAYAAWVRAATLIGLAGFAAAWWFSRRQQAFNALLVTAVAGTLGTSLLLCGHNSLARSNSSYHLAQAIKDLAPPEVPFYSIKTYDQTLPFYLQRTFILVHYRDELDLGLKAEPHKAIDTLEAFRVRWNQDRRALAILRPDDYDSLLKDNFIPMRVIARDTRRVVIAKP